MPILASRSHTQIPGPVSAQQTLLIAHHENRPSRALLPLLLPNQSGLATEQSQNKKTRTARVSNATVTASCTLLPFADLPEKLKYLCSPMIINALDSLMRLKLHK
jgi:hypothetical protein